MAQHDESRMSDDDATETARPTSESRRNLMKKAGVVAAGAWVAPVVLTRSAAAAATADPPVLCPICNLNVITNNNFEGSNPLVGWALSGPTGFSVAAVTYASVISQITAPPGSGSNVARLTGWDNGTSSGAKMSQTFTVPQECRGKAFTLSAYAAARGGATNGGRIGLSVSGTPGSNLFVPSTLPTDPAANMTLESISGTLPPGIGGVTVIIEFEVVNDSAFYVDLVSFVVGC